AREVRAPIDGLVLRYDFVEGELVRPDMVLLEIFGGERQMLKLRIPERHATRVSVGDRYRARLVSFRGLRDEWFTGELKTLRHVIQYEGAQGYRVAYCDFDAGGRMVPPGATAEAKIYCGRIRLWFFLLGLD
ncbi:MAG: HlyD family secretion protein, partial [Lentisphaerae bacterium]|nr:HlyD family secretion protein [Lentisphaerota bacterium]